MIPSRVSLLKAGFAPTISVICDMEQIIAVYKHIVNIVVYTTNHMHEFHFALPHIDRRVAIGIFVTALISALALTSCVGAEQISANTILNECETISEELFEGGIIAVEGANPDHSIGYNGKAHIINPFYVKGRRGRMYYVGYRYDNPRLQFFVPEDMATKTGNCNVEIGTPELYDPDSGYLFVTPSGKPIHAGYIWIERKQK